MEKKIKNNGKVFNPFKKLMIGIALVSVFALVNVYVGVDGLVGIKNSIRNGLLGFMSENLSTMFSSLIVLPIPVFMVYAAVSGTYRIFTCTQYIPTFEDNTPGGVPVKGSDSFPNINRVLSYRESKMCSMSPERAADLYVGSAKIESLYSNYNNGPEAQRTLSYIESKLCSMSSDRALNYLANKL
jgi:hypothetical protein